MNKDDPLRTYYMHRVRRRGMDDILYILEDFELFMSDLFTESFEQAAAQIGVSTDDRRFHKLMHEVFRPSAFRMMAELAHLYVVAPTDRTHPIPVFFYLSDVDRETLETIFSLRCRFISVDYPPMEMGPVPVTEEKP
jgi:hypothetical protein